MWSVGIDIGTSTTQCVFSSMRLVNQAPAFAVPRIVLTDKRVLYRAPIHLTPLSAPDTIDADAIRAMVAEDYRAAGMKPEQISMGAVIITGETARKQNANAVTEALAEFAGDFVVATAGPALESILAGKGSGAAALSATLRKRVLNLDIGGGTANLCLFCAGEPVQTGCVDIGGRLLRRDPETYAVRSFSTQMGRIAMDIGLSLRVGEPVGDSEMRRLATRMAEILEEAAGLRERTAIYDMLVVEHGLPNDIHADVYTFSGGVAGCVYGMPQSALFKDDIGKFLGKALSVSRFYAQGRVLQPEETQHATVIGAGVYSVDVSGSTVLYENTRFPMLGLPVGKILLEGPEDIDGLSDQIEKQRFIHGETFAICFEGWKSPAYRDIEAIAEALYNAIPKDVACPVIVITQDMAKALGQALQRLMGRGRPLVCLDGVSLSFGDTIDIGAPMAGGRVLPIIVKTFAFSR